jgi:selenocysteine lyase/cysteine desulfurase
MTRVVALSFVQFDSGFRANLHDLSEVCHRRGALLVVDAMQGLGAVPLNVRAEGVDVLSAGAYKWLLGMKGSGIFFLRKDLLSLLDPVHSGFGSMAHWRLPDFSSTEYPWDLSPRAARFEEGTPNVLGAVGLGAALRLLAGLGSDAVVERIRILTDFLCAELVSHGHALLSPRGAGEWSGIVLFRPRRGSADSWIERFLEERILMNAREDCLQMGVHFYNNKEEIERAVRILSAS